MLAISNTLNISWQLNQWPLRPKKRGWGWSQIYTYYTYIYIYIYSQSVIHYSGMSTVWMLVSKDGTVYTVKTKKEGAESCELHLHYTEQAYKLTTNQEKFIQITAISINFAKQILKKKKKQHSTTLIRLTAENFSWRQLIVASSSRRALRFPLNAHTNTI